MILFSHYYDYFLSEVTPMTVKVMGRLSDFSHHSSRHQSQSLLNLPEFLLRRKNKMLNEIEREFLEERLQLSHIMHQIKRECIQNNGMDFIIKNFTCIR